MLVLENLLYTKNHEWIRVEEDKAYIGITDYAKIIRRYSFCRFTIRRR